ncbi:hypothetical protein HDV57DRAFT_31901 [Trichoderma longibrachiatum]|uniref:Uncharacterized protein n=1 Tax=Trichoderma longibrachiatum ATCC 18648 TaxID=983965 RepID=A0A2T4CHU5_TRILO|nr:hypothetical protein M440DRAFT_1008842 [Trichoderma longibrachiatum ATCC 18648]
MYSAREAILLVSSGGRANIGLCLMALVSVRRCGRTTPLSAAAKTRAPAKHPFRPRHGECWQAAQGQTCTCTLSLPLPVRMRSVQSTNNLPCNKACKSLAFDEQAPVVPPSSLSPMSRPLSRPPVSNWLYHHTPSRANDTTGFHGRAGYRTSCEWLKWLDRPHTLSSLPV